MKMPARPDNGNKGTFGRVVIIGGSDHFIGAPILCGQAAYRTGCGLVKQVVPEIVRNCGAWNSLESIWACDEFESGTLALKERDAVVIGPGLGTAETIRERLYRWLTCLDGKTRGIVLDADALNLLSLDPDWAQKIPARCVLTPHPGEMARLTGMEISAIQADRVRIAKRFAKQWDQIVLLKGAHSVIAAPDGTVDVLPYETAALAVAGSGDVLAGIIASLMAQGMEPYEAAQLGASLHGEAGSFAGNAYGQTYSVTAGDILMCIPAVIGKGTWYGSND